MEYNENITIVNENPSMTDKLQDDEYFALMVIADPKDSDYVFFDYSKWYLALECMSDKKIYISKDSSKRENTLRGKTMIVKVDDPSLCRILS